MELFLGWSLWAAADAGVGARQVSAFRSSVTDDHHRDVGCGWGAPAQMAPTLINFKCKNTTKRVKTS